MSLDGFIVSLKRQLSAEHAERELAVTGLERGQCTRKINEIERAIVKATRKGIQE